MRVVKIVFGIGYGRHTDEMEFGDDVSDEEIESAVQDYVMEKLDWGFEIEGEFIPSQPSPTPNT